MLKNVVLPAPLGPISPTIAPSSIVKSTLLTATRPPKRLVNPWTTSRSVIGDRVRPERRRAVGRPVLLRPAARPAALRRLRRQRAVRPLADDWERCPRVAYSSR